MTDTISTEGQPAAAPLVGAAPSPMQAAPPHPLDAEWFMNASGQSYGPYSGHRFKEFMSEGRVTADTQVVRAGASDWHRVIDDPILGSLALHRPLHAPSNTVAAEKGATVVQVTNNIGPNPGLLAFLGDGGLAEPKSAGLALVLSLLIVGLGQLYNGQVGKGILMFFGCIFLWFILLGWIINIWSIVDAYQTAKKMNLRYQQILLASAAR